MQSTMNRGKSECWRDPGIDPLHAEAMKYSNSYEYRAEPRNNKTYANERTNERPQWRKLIVFVYDMASISSTTNLAPFPRQNHFAYVHHTLAPCPSNSCSIWSILTASSYSLPIHHCWCFCLFFCIDIHEYWTCCVFGLLVCMSCKWLDVVKLPLCSILLLMWFYACPFPCAGMHMHARTLSIQFSWV